MGSICATTNSVEEGDVKSKENKGIVSSKKLEFKQNDDSSPGQDDLQTLKFPPFVKTTFFVPKKYTTKESQKIDDTPEFSLELEFIYGSSRKGVKGKTLYCNKNGEIVYPSAACVVLYNIVKHSQRIFVKHKDDVKCISMHPNQEYFASGECGKNDMVYVWNSIDLSTISSLETHKIFKNGGALSLSFNSKGSKLAVLGGSVQDSQIVIYQWKSGEVRAKAHCSQRIPYCIEFSHSASQSLKKRITFCGKNEIKFVTYSKRKIKEEKGIVSSKGGKLQKNYCCEFDDSGRCFVGTRDGSIYIFNHNELLHHQKVHGGAIKGLRRLKGGKKFISVGNEHVINVYDFIDKSPYYMKIKTVKFDKTFGYGSDACFISENDVILWTSHGNFIRVNLESEKCEVLMKGHSGLKIRNELWGVDVVKENGGRYFYTAGDDGKVFLWNGKTRKAHKVMQMKHIHIRSIGVNPNDMNDIVIGGKEGKVAVVKTKKELHCGKEEISIIKFNPSGTFVAIGSHDNHIYMFDVKKKYKHVATLKSHSSFITMIDWSEDGEYLKSTSGDYELLYWNVTSMGRVLNHSNLVDVKWVNQNCTIGFGVRGVWQQIGDKRLDGSDVNSVCVDENKNLLVSVDDFGYVNVYKYPTLSNKPKRTQYLGHSSHPTRCKFSYDGKFLWSLGGGDLSIFQWKVKKIEG